MTCRDDEELPVLEWEAKEARRRIPEDLRRLIGAPTRIIRVPQHVQEKIATKHGRDTAIYERFDELIESWEFYRKNRERWEVYMPADERGDRAVVISAVDRNGSYSLVTFYSARFRNLRNRALIPRGS